MEGDRIVRVECLTCRGHHNYRRPRSEEPVKKPAKRAAPAGGSPRTPRISTAVEARRAWEKAIMGKSPDDFTGYHISESFRQGQLVRHKKFGDGVVIELLEDGKVQVLFEDGAKTLVHGRT